MAFNNLIKPLLATSLFIISAAHMQAQQNKMALQILPAAGMPIQFLNKDIYSGKPLNFSGQMGIGVQKDISSKIFIGVEVQYGQYHLQKNIQQTYSTFITPASVQNYAASKVLSGLLNIGYALKTKKGKKGGGETGIALGAGIQRLTSKGNSLQIPNPYNNGRLMYLYHENEGKYNSLLLQLSFTQTFYLKPNFGITGGVKLQYAGTGPTATYKPVPVEDYTMPPANKIFLSPDLVGKTNRGFILVPGIGVKYLFSAA